MRVGLEYEGILKFKGKQVRFKSIDKDIKAEIIKLYGEYPCDGNDYLIEVRTEPHTNKNVLLNELLYKKKLIETILEKYHYTVTWKEEKILKNDKYSLDDKKTNKINYQLVIDKDKNILIGKYIIRDNIYRGGGLHINFDQYIIDNKYIDYSRLISIYDSLKPLSDNKIMKSKYRKGLIFRQHKFGFELISLGLNLNKNVNKLSKLLNRLYEAD